MAKPVGLIIQGDDNANNLTVTLVREENGSLSVYNVIQAGGGKDVLSGRPSSYDDQDIISKFGVQLFGEDGNDIIYDSYVNDTLSGGAGDDVIYYHKGRDKIDGGEGFDSLTVNYPTTSLGHLNLTGIEEIVLEGTVSVGSFDLNEVEVLRPDDRWRRRTLTFSNPAEVTNVVFLGEKGWHLDASRYDDTFDVSASAVQFQIESGKGNDTVISGTRKDIIHGDDGDDLLKGGGGNDYLYGDDGNDTLLGGAGNDRIFVSSGTDVIDGGAGDDILFGMLVRSPHSERGWDLSNITVKGIETLKFDKYADWITGDADTLGGFEQIVGPRGNGFQINFSSGGHFTWHAALQLGEKGAVNGSSQADYIDMSASNNAWTILGGAGNDVLTAGKGNNTLAGEAGRDTFVFERDAGLTTIVDYKAKGSNHDIIDLSAVGSIKSFNDLIDHHARETGNGDWLKIDLGEGEINLYHVHIKNLQESGFLFHE